jgi:hypothetical protein
VGGFEVPALAGMEPSLKYHPYCIRILILSLETGQETMPGGQFDWGGFLLKSNGGVQRFPQCGWQSHGERKGIRELNCETY